LAEKYPISVNENNMHNCVLDDRIQLLFGEPQWNSEGNEMVVPMRLFNASPDTIIELISVQLSNIRLSGSRAKTYAKVTLPKFFDSVHSTFGDSVKFVYPISLHSSLFPNGVTSVLSLHMHITEPEWIDFALQATITGGGCLLVK